MDSIVPQLLLCWVVIFTVINLTFGLSQKIRNAGIVDVLWGFSFCAVTIFFTLTGDGGVQAVNRFAVQLRASQNASLIQ